MTVTINQRNSAQKYHRKRTKLNPTIPTSSNTRKWRERVGSRLSGDRALPSFVEFMCILCTTSPPSRAASSTQGCSHATAWLLVTSGKETAFAQRGVVRIPHLVHTSEDYFKFKNREKKLGLFAVSRAFVLLSQLRLSAPWDRDQNLLPEVSKLPIEPHSKCSKP